MIKTGWYWYRDWQIGQWNIIEDPKMNPHTYGYLTKKLKLSSGKKTAFSTNDAGSTGS